MNKLTRVKYDMLSPCTARSRLKQVFNHIEFYSYQLKAGTALIRPARYNRSKIELFNSVLESLAGLESGNLACGNSHCFACSRIASLLL